MNGIDYLADTNCFIYLLEEYPLLLSFSENPWAFSYITEMELLSCKKISKKEDLIIRNLLSTCFRIDHNQEITEHTISLKRRYGLKLPDAIIAATAINSNLPLLTADKDFAQIQEIDCFLLDFS